MRPSCRILLCTGSSLLATILGLSGTASRTQTIGASGTQGAVQGSPRPQPKADFSLRCASLGMTCHPDRSLRRQGSAFLRRLGRVSEFAVQGAPSHPATADYWSDPASELATRILMHATAQDTLALTVRNISSLGEDDVVQIRRDLRSQLHSQHGRLTASGRASIEVRVSLSENIDGYLWVAEIENSPSRRSTEKAALTRQIVMLTVAGPKPVAVHSVPAPLTIRKTLVYEQGAPMLDFVPLDGSSPEPLGPATPAGTIVRALVLGLARCRSTRKLSRPRIRTQPGG